MRKSAHLLKEKSRFMQNVLIFKTLYRPNKLHLCTAFESLAYSHSLVPPLDLKITPNSSAWDVQLLIIRAYQGFVSMLIFYPALHSHQSQCYSHWTHYSKTFHNAISGFPKVNCAEWGGWELRGGRNDPGEPVQWGTQVSGILLQDPNPSQSHLWFGTAWWWRSTLA